MDYFYIARDSGKSASEKEVHVVSQTNLSASDHTMPIDGRNIQQSKRILERQEMFEFITENGLEKYARYMVDNIFTQKTVQQTEVVSIINATPDSFFKDSRIQYSPDIIDRALISGCKWVDVGGESTRPRSKGISYKEEIERLEPIMQSVSEVKKFKVSLDTKHLKTAEHFEKEIDMVNDVSGNDDPELARFASETGKSYVLMHTRGTPENMVNFTEYSDLIAEISNFIWKNLIVLHDIGMKPEKIVIDPGIGFAKSGKQNYELIKNFKSFDFGFRRMFGYSRKSFLGAKGDSPENKLIETLAITAYLAAGGVEFLRVHDPEESMKVLKTLRHLLP